ncbi:Hypp4173 [Branchiostoma lanceolatum]|uniref:Hypp4173 protein n=1 Tax=Branchiostoma lanceolatum TaxID=7740 RepID=A0A8K0A752_BRALA|nr:Hypp4173 [Branchiostoma lanceolatum]
MKMRKYKDTVVQTKAIGLHAGHTTKWSPLAAKSKVSAPKGEELLDLFRSSGTLDGYNIRQFERQMRRFDANILPAAQGEDLPQAPWTLTKAQLRLADERLASIKGATGHSFRPDMAMFADGGANLKTEEIIYAVSHGVVKFCLRGLLGDQQRHAVNEYCDAIANFLEGTSPHQLDEIQVWNFAQALPVLLLQTTLGVAVGSTL